MIMTTCYCFCSIAQVPSEANSATSDDHVRTRLRKRGGKPPKNRKNAAKLQSEGKLDGAKKGFGLTSVGVDESSKESDDGMGSAGLEKRAEVNTARSGCVDGANGRDDVKAVGVDSGDGVRSAGVDDSEGIMRSDGVDDGGVGIVKSAGVDDAKRGGIMESSRVDDGIVKNSRVDNAKGDGIVGSSRVKRGDIMKSARAKRGGIAGSSKVNDVTKRDSMVGSSGVDDAKGDDIVGSSRMDDKRGGIMKNARAKRGGIAGSSKVDDKRGGIVGSAGVDDVKRGGIVGSSRVDDKRGGIVVSVGVDNVKRAGIVGSAGVDDVKRGGIVRSAGVDDVKRSDDDINTVSAPIVCEDGGIGDSVSGSGDGSEGGSGRGEGGGGGDKSARDVKTITIEGADSTTGMTGSDSMTSSATQKDTRISAADSQGCAPLLNTSMDVVTTANDEIDLAAKEKTSQTESSVLQLQVSYPRKGIVLSQPLRRGRPSKKKNNEVTNKVSSNPVSIKKRGRPPTRKSERIKLQSNSIGSSKSDQPQNPDGGDGRGASEIGAEHPPPAKRSRLEPQPSLSSVDAPLNGPSRNSKTQNKTTSKQILGKKKRGRPPKNPLTTKPPSEVDSNERDISPEIPLQNLKPGESLSISSPSSRKLKKRKSLESVLSTIMKLGKNGVLSPVDELASKSKTTELVGEAVVVSRNEQGDQVTNTDVDSEPFRELGKGKNKAGESAGRSYKDERTQPKSSPVRKRKKLVGKETRAKSGAFSLSVVDDLVRESLCMGSGKLSNYVIGSSMIFSIATNLAALGWPWNLTHTVIKILISTKMAF